MSYRKFKADQIFDGYKFLPGSPVLVTDEYGVIQDIVEESKAGDNIEILKGLLCPGFINCHCHLELSHMRARIAEGKGLVEFVMEVMQHRNAGAVEINEAIASAEKEMLANGIVAVGDICNTTTTLLQKEKRNLRYYNFIEATGFIDSNAEARLDVFKKILSEFENSGETSIVPHAPYSVSSSLLKLIARQDRGKTISIHNQESDAEHEFFTTGAGDFNDLYKRIGVDISTFKASGTSSLQHFLNNFSFQGNIILVHNLTTSAADIKIAEETSRQMGANLFWCFCPNANLYISGRLPDINLFEKKNIVLGTDSLASNHQLSILEEMKTLTRYFPRIKLETMLQWATINGARALQMQDMLGSFEKNKKPGVVLIGGVENNKMMHDSFVQRIL